jgi:hypothetical protein
MNPTRFRLSILLLSLAVTLAPLGAQAPVSAEPEPAEWSQHAFNAQRTSYAPQEIPTPWRWSWSWNGPDSQGNPVPDKFTLPRNVQPVTGDGRVYVAAGEHGVYALDQVDRDGDRQADVLWHAEQVGKVNSTAAYDAETQSVFVLSAEGVLYKLAADTGRTRASFTLAEASTLPLPPALHGGAVFVGMGTGVYAIDKYSLALRWQYTTSSPVHTPPAYSPSADRVIVGTQDLFVYAINNADGTGAWRVKPTVRPAGPPVEYAYGWPVIAEQNGLVLIKVRLDWDTMWTWNPWPTTNAEIRANLTERPDQQALFALRLSDGSVPFIMNVGHGGYGDGGYMPMGPQPVIRTLPEGGEAAYIVIRGDSRYDGRWDSHFGEVVLNDTTVPGLTGGDVRWIQYGNFGWPPLSNHDTPYTDEQVNVSMAGGQLFGGHWALGNALTITNRGPDYGAYTDPIRSAPLPHIVSSTNVVPFSRSHYSGSSIAMTAGGTEWRAVPYGFYIYQDAVGKIYDRYWSGYSVWVPSGDRLYFRSTDGAIVALESGSPTAAQDGGQFLTVADIRAARPAVSLSAPQRIDYQQAALYSGQAVSVTGTVEYIFNNGKTVLLGFADPHQDVFKVQIPRALWPDFAGALGAQMGRNQETLIREGDRVQVRGIVTWYQGDPVILLAAPQDLIVNPTEADEKGS